MITMEVFMDIFALRRQGMSMRSIARKLGIHRNTVKKYLEGSHPPVYCKHARKASILDSFKPAIDAYLKEDDYQATWIFDRLKHMGYSGGYDTVKLYVRGIKEQLKRIAYIRFESEPDYQAQMDWGDFQVADPCGRDYTLHLFIMLLGFSRAMYARFVEQCTLQSFMDCHIRALRYLGGVPAEILYDNMKNVVISRKNGIVVFNHEFLGFANHYRFKPEPCPPYSPWVKGKVERPVDYIRERFWRGYVFESIEKANHDLLCWLDETANRRIHGTHRQSVLHRWQQEKPSLAELPPRDYDTSLKVYRKVYKDCQVSFEANRYLLPHDVVGKMVMLKVKNDTIRFYHDERLLATYRKPQGKHQQIGNPLFYDQLKRDRQQLKRKYGRTKGKATRGLANGSLFPQVHYRPVADYERIIRGGATWNN